MKVKGITSILVVVAAILLALPSSQAQNIGFSVGIASPIAPITTSPILPFVTSPVVGFGVAPILTPPIGRFSVTPPLIAVRPPVRAIGRPPVRGAHIRPIVIAPGAIFIPGTVIVAPAPEPIHHSPVRGMPRAQVIEQYGSPSVSIVTRSGETLHYPNGVVIVLQDGFVVPR